MKTPPLTIDQADRMIENKLRRTMTTKTTNPLAKFKSVLPQELSNGNLTPMFERTRSCRILPASQQTSFGSSNLMTSDSDHQTSILPSQHKHYTWQNIEPRAFKAAKRAEFSFSRKSENDSTMNDYNSGNFKRGAYARISTDLRTRLIKMVCEDGIGVVQASAALNIKYTTGKHIVRRYKATGHYVDKRFKLATKRGVEQVKATQMEAAEVFNQQADISRTLTENDEASEAAEGGVAQPTAEQPAHNDQMDAQLDYQVDKPSALPVWPNLPQFSIHQGRLIDQPRQKSDEQPAPQIRNMMSIFASGSDQNTFLSPQQTRPMFEIRTVCINGKKLRFVFRNRV